MSSLVATATVSRWSLTKAPILMTVHSFSKRSMDITDYKVTHKRNCKEIQHGPHPTAKIAGLYYSMTDEAGSSEVRTEAPLADIDRFQCGQLLQPLRPKQPT